MPLGIQVQHSTYVHTQNSLAESLIKRIKLIARPLLQNCNLPTSCWSHAVLHAADLIQLRPTAYHVVSPLQLVRGNMPNIFHLRKFGCAIYVRSHCLSVPLWAHIENLVSMWDINLHQLSNTSSLLQGTYSWPDTLTAYLMRTISRH